MAEIAGMSFSAVAVNPWSKSRRAPSKQRTGLYLPKVGVFSIITDATGFSISAIWFALTRWSAVEKTRSMHLKSRDAIGNSESRIRPRGSITSLFTLGPIERGQREPMSSQAHRPPSIGRQLPMTHDGRIGTVPNRCG